MALTARELVFYIRAEDQASRVVKRVGASFGSLANIKDLQAKADVQQIKNLKDIDKAQQKIRQNEDAIRRASIAANALGTNSVANVAARKRVDDLGQALRRNNESLLRAEALQSKLNRAVESGKPFKGSTMAEMRLQQQAAQSAVETLGRQNSLLERQQTLAKSGVFTTAATQSAKQQAALSGLAGLRKQEEMLAADLDEVRRAGDAASASIERQISEAKIARLNSYVLGVQNAARALRLIGIVGVASFAAAAYSAAKFSQQVTLAATQARPVGAGSAVTAQIGTNIQAEILKQMQQFPATAQEMSNSFYQIFSGTNIQSVKQAAAYVKIFNEAAVAGGASLDEMTQAGISIRNVFGIGLGGEFKNLTQAMNVFFAAVRYGRMTASQFSEALGYISPIAKDVQLSFRNIAEDMAFFTRQTGGNMTRQDAQGLARLIQLLARDDVVAGLAAKGIPVFDKLTGKMRPVLEIIKQIHDQLHLTPQETVNFFKAISSAGSGKAGTQGTIQAIRVFSQGIQNAKAYQDVVNHVRVDNDEFMRSYLALSKTPGVRWQIVLNQIKAAVIMIGTEAIPAFVALSKPLVQALHWFNGLSESTKHVIAYIGVFGSVALVLGGTLAIMVGWIVKLGNSIKLLQISRLAEEGGFVSARLALIGGAFGALITIMAIFHVSILKVFTGSTGFHGLLVASEVAVTALSVAMLTRLVPAEAAAALGMGALTKATNLQIVAIGLLSYGLSRLIDKALGKKNTEALGRMGAKVYDLTHASVNTTTPDHMQNDIAKINQLYMGMQAKYGTTDLKPPDSVIKKQLEALFPQLSDHDIEVFVDHAGKIYQARVRAMQQSQFTQATRTANFGQLPVQYKGVTTADVVTTSELLAGLRRAYTLQQALQKAPNLTEGHKAYLAYTNYVIKITKGMTTAQKQEFQTLLGQMSQFADIANKPFMEVVKAADAVQKLQDAASAAPKDLSKWQAFFAAQAALTKKYSSAQISEAQQVVQAWEQAAPTPTHTQAQVDALAKNADRLNKIATKTNSPEAWAKYYAAVDALGKASVGHQQDIANSIISASQAVHDKQVQLAKDAATKQKQAATDAANAIQSATQGILQMYNTILQQNQALFGDLFAGPVINGPRVQDNLQFGGHIVGTDLLHDLQTQIIQYRNINREFDTLAAKGAPKKFIDQLRALGPGATKDIQALKQLTPEQFKQYVEAWKKGQSMVNKNTMTQLNSQLALYRQYGKNIARAIIAGLRSDNVNLENEMRNIVIKMFPALANKANTGLNYSRKEFALPGNNVGMLKSGNLDLLHRKVATVGNDIATVRSITVGFGKKFVLLPTIINGIARSNQFAINYFRKTGQNLGTFASEKAADRYAQRLHLQQAGYYKNSKPTHTTINNHKTIHVTTTAPANDVRTQLKHADFVDRNKYRQP